ncbi:hypothetical protein LTR95_013380 [Oleoguttula sp. CCFEE 5521]
MKTLYLRQSGPQSAGGFLNLLFSSVGFSTIPFLRDLSSDFETAVSSHQIASLVPQTDDRRPHHVSNSKALSHLDLVDLSSADILLSNYGGERVAAGVLAAWTESEDGEVGLTGVGAGYAAEDYGAGFGDEDAGRSGNGEGWVWGGLRGGGFRERASKGGEEVAGVNMGA